jgi:putative two-component system response regulator
MSHHERWNGSGYPQGLAGDAIPLAARLMALADVFDAMTSRRVYKSPIPFADVRAMMAEQRGKHFDPDLLDNFIAGFEDFCAIARQYPDQPAPETVAPAPATAVASTA